MTTSASGNRPGLNTASLAHQPVFQRFGSSPMSGMGMASMPSAKPSALSVRQTKRNGIDRFRLTAA